MLILGSTSQELQIFEVQHAKKLLGQAKLIHSLSSGIIERITYGQEVIFIFIAWNNVL